MAQDYYAGYARVYEGEIIQSDRVGEHIYLHRVPIGVSVGICPWNFPVFVMARKIAPALVTEYPQTVALVLSKLKPQISSKVLSILPKEFSLDVMMRMLNLDVVKKEILDNIERTIKNEFISNLAKTKKYDSHSQMAEIFNSFDRMNEAKYMALLESKVPETADRIKNLMFTFDDLIKLPDPSIQTLIRLIDKAKLAMALKGANQQVKDLFLNNMSQRASKILEEDMQAIGPVKLREVDESQTDIIAQVKELADKGEIVIGEGSDGDEYVY
ncbi:MAG: aldehyde dehydrogenase family protein [Pseudomonadota bacterium]